MLYTQWPLGWSTDRILPLPPFYILPYLTKLPYSSLLFSSLLFSISNVLSSCKSKFRNLHIKGDFYYYRDRSLVPPSPTPNSDCSLQIPERPITVNVFTGMRASKSLWSVRKLILSGKYELRPAAKKLYQLRPEVTASSVSVASQGDRFKCISFFFMFCWPCV